jgi:predicted permease
MPRGRTLAKRVFKWMARLLPFDFRRDYGQEMERAFADDLDDPAKRQRPSRTWTTFARAVAGIGPLALREHAAIARQDVAYALRVLAGQRGFTITALLSLAFGIGATTATFSLVDALFLHPLPVTAEDRLVALYTVDSRNTGFNPSSYPNFLDYQRSARGFAGLTAYTFTPVNLSTGGEPQQVLASIVAGNFFNVLGVAAARGRVLNPSDARVEGHAPVVVLSDGFWTRRFGANPAIVGQTIRLNGMPCTVVGVIPRAFTGVDIGLRVDLWVPLSAHAALVPDTPDLLTERRLLQFAIIGRLAAGTSIAEAQSAAAALAVSLSREYPEANRDRAMHLIPLRTAAVDPNLRSTLVAASSVVGVIVVLVLFISCANVASLLLGRATARRTEMAVRVALGAGRLRLVRQLLTEQLVLAFGGAAGGLALGAAAWRVLWATRPAGALPVIEFHTELDARVLAFGVIVATVTALLFGLVPLLHVVRSAPIEDLRNRVADSHTTRWSVRNLLLGGEIALAIVALVTAGLFVQSFDHARRIAPGFAAKELIVTSLDLGAQGYSLERATTFERTVAARIATLPQVRRVSWSSLLPLVGGGFQRTVFLDGDAPPPGGNGQFVTTNIVDREYFDTVGLRLIAGRRFAEYDAADAAGVAVVNETMARRFWPGRDPIGRRFHFFGERTLVVAGIVADSKIGTLGEDPTPVAYLPLLQWPARALTLNVRVAGDPTPLVPLIRREIHAIDAELPLTNLGAMSGHVTTALWTPRAGAFVLGVFAGIALSLALIGLYGVLSYGIAIRRRELAIRLALGAAERQILGMLVKETLWVVIPALVVGIVAAALVGQLTSGLLFDVPALDVTTFAVVPLLFLTTAFVAAYRPARRAARVDPTITLRQM